MIGFLQGFFLLRLFRLLCLLGLSTSVPVVFSRGVRLLYCLHEWVQPIYVGFYRFVVVGLQSTGRVEGHYANVG